jgi:hypothetical protein
MTREELKSIIRETMDKVKKNMSHIELI